MHSKGQSSRKKKYVFRDGKAWLLKNCVQDLPAIGFLILGINMLEECS